jgi:hydrogenase maturation protease
MSTLVLGLGNLVHADDGVGVHAIERLQKDTRVPEGVTMIDGGTHGLGLLPYVAGYERVLVIDAVDVGEKPGTLIRLEGRAVENMPGKASVHQLGFADMLVGLKLLGERPPEVIVIGVQPQSTEWSAELTPTVQQAMDELADVVIAQLNEWALEPASL